MATVRAALSKRQINRVFDLAFPDGSGRDPTELAYRRDVLKLVQAALGCIVAEQDDLQLRGDILTWNRIKNSDAIRWFGALGQRDTLSLLHVLGVHFIDRLAGRVSKIWASPSALNSSAMPKSLSGHFFWELYGKLWMRTYWRARRSSLTLLSAFQEEILRAPRKPVLVRWGTNALTPDHARRVIDLQLPYDDQFVQRTRTLATEFDRILTETIDDQAQSEARATRTGRAARQVVAKIDGKIAWSSSASEYEKQMFASRVEDAAYAALVSACVLARFEDVRTDYAYRVLTVAAIRQRLASLIRPVSARLSHFLGTDMSEAARRHDVLWENVLHVIEALQSAILNEPRFCNENGILIGSWKTGSNGLRGIGTLRLVAGLKDNRLTFLDRLALLSESSMRLLRRGDKQVRLGRASGTHPRSVKHNIATAALLDEVEEKLRASNVLIPARGLRKWVEVVHRLAATAIHEGEPIYYSLGCGPAYVPTVQGHLYTTAPAHLSKRSSSTEQVVHYAKAYFSLFGAPGRVLWFDEEGRFQAVYEGEARDASGIWLVGKWRGLERCCFAAVKGRGRIDFRDRNRQLLVRVVDDKISKAETTSTTSVVISRACEKIFGRASQWVPAMTKIIDRVVHRLQDEAHASGLVVSSSLGAQKRSGWKLWRRSIDEQVKSLAPALVRPDGPVAPQGESPVLVASSDGRLEEKAYDFVADHVMPLTKLDGAIWFSVDADGLRVRSPMQFIPLVKSSRDNNEPIVRLFDLDEWEKVWRETGPSQGAIVRFARGLNGVLQDQADVTKLEHSLLLAAFIRGVVDPSQYPSQNWKSIEDVTRELTFLNSAGTRHHSLWGISLTTREKLFAVSRSQDGNLRVFWSGREL